MLSTPRTLNVMACLLLIEGAMLVVPLATAASDCPIEIDGTGAAGQASVCYEVRQDPTCPFWPYCAPIPTVAARTSASLADGSLARSHSYARCGLPPCSAVASVGIADVADVRAYPFARSACYQVPGAGVAYGCSLVLFGLYPPGVCYAVHPVVHGPPERPAYRCTPHDDLNS